MNRNTGTTVIGGALGLEQLYEALDLLGETGPDWKVGALIVKALVIMALGYFSFKESKSD